MTKAILLVCLALLAASQCLKYAGEPFVLYCTFSAALLHVAAHTILQQYKNSGN
jgi:hypothetical protein